MISSILKAAAPMLNSGESPEAKIARLAHSVMIKMKEVEKQAKKEEITCFSLYSHWFLSFIVLAECSIRLTIHCTVIAIFFVLYYLIFCLSCGKANIGMMKGHHLTRCSLYSGLLFAMLGNLVAPWDPVFYMFRLPTTLSRPNVPMTNLQLDDISSLDVENFLVNDVLCCCCNCCGCRSGHCACCGQPLEAILPAYKLAQVTFLYRLFILTPIMQLSLFVVGCNRGCGVYQWVGGDQHQQVIENALREIERETESPTRAFFEQYYGCSSFDEYVRREIYGHPSSQPPIYAQAVTVQAIPIARPVN